MGGKNRVRVAPLKRLVRRVVLLVLLSVLCVAGLVAALWFRSYPVTFDTEGARGISFEPWRELIPGPGLPGDLGLMSSNNNLDVVRYGETFFIASRTAPTHFASEKTRVLVQRSADRKTWERDGQFQFGCDIREPRFLVYHDTLFLYFFKAGKSLFKFEPQGIFVTSRGKDGRWAEPKPVFKPGFVVWRAHVFGDTAYMSVYNGAGLYTTGDRQGDLRLLVSHDGYAWDAISEKPQVDTISAEEGEFAFDEEGNLCATVRLETGGGMVCRAAKDDLAHWECVRTDAKYDSALMFRHGAKFYVIARRNVAGPFAGGGDWLPKSWQRGWWLARYSLTRKRTALYAVDTDGMALRPLFDFPSKGDTAFAGIVPLGTDDYWVANYSCPLDGPDWPWIFGQFAGTRIYDTTLHMGTVG